MHVYFSVLITLFCGTLAVSLKCHSFHFCYFSASFSSVMVRRVQLTVFQHYLTTSYARLSSQCVDNQSLAVSFASVVAAIVVAVEKWRLGPLEKDFPSKR